MAITPQFEAANDFHDGMALIFNDGWGIVDKQGKVIVLHQYSSARDFSNGYARVEKDQRWGYIDINGNEVIPLKYENADDFEGGLALVKSNGKWGYIDVKGKEFFRD